MIKEPQKNRDINGYVFAKSESDEEHVAREREYWRFDPYEDIGPLFYSDLYEGDGGKERWSDWG